MNDATSSDGEKAIPSFPFLEKPAASAGTAGEAPVFFKPKGAAPADELERLRQSLDSAVQEALRSFHAYLAALGGQAPTSLAAAPQAAPRALEPLMPVEEPQPEESFPLSRLAAGKSPGRTAPRAALSAALKEKLEKGLAEAFAAEEAKAMLPPARTAPAKPALTPPPLPVEAVLPAVAPIAPPPSPFSTVEAAPSPFAVVALPKKEEAPQAPETIPALSPFALEEKATPAPVPPVAKNELPVPAPAPAAEIPPAPPALTPPPLPSVMPETLAPFSLAQQPQPVPPNAAPVLPEPSVSAPPPPAVEAPAPLPFSPFQGLEPAPPPPLLDKASAAPLSGITHPIIAENAPAWNPSTPHAPPPVFPPAAVDATAPVLAAAKTEEMMGAHSAIALEEAERPLPKPPLVVPAPPSIPAVETAAFPPAPPQAADSIAPPAPPLFGSTQAATAPFRLGGETAAPPAPPATSHTSFNPFALPADEETSIASTPPAKPAPPALESTPSPAQRLSGPEEPPAEIAFNFTEILRAAGQQRPS